MHDFANSDRTCRQWLPGTLYREDFLRVGLFTVPYTGRESQSYESPSGRNLPCLRGNPTVLGFERQVARPE